MTGAASIGVESPYFLASVRLARRVQLSPSLVRFTFDGDDVARMCTLAPDQRIKLFFPQSFGISVLEDGPDWYARYKGISADKRPAMRTYTIRRLRDEPAELDVDFVLHGETGPATRWAMHARPRDLLQIAAPNAEFRADPGGYEWRPPPQLARLILFGDETALPAISGILDALAASSSPPRTEVFVEVPMPGDRIAVTTWPDCRLSWTVRSGTPGETLLRSARDLTLSETHAPHEAAPIVNVDREILWETNAAPSDGLYIWAAGEAKAILELRKFLQSERGVGRYAMNMMGYWRLGRSLDD